VILFKGQIDISLFIRFLDFSVNKILYLLFHIKNKNKKITIYKYLKTSNLQALFT
jgi:hypothetical protein